MPENQPSLRSRSLAERYQIVRQNTMDLARNLSDADATVQSMEDASPAKWHLAHTTWFFETLILKPHSADYQVFDPAYNFLFNSYYDAIGERHPRPQRGMLTRPTLKEVFQYRAYVDQRVDELLEETCAEEILRLFELGLNHEQQHQELFLTDILHLFAQNPLKPAFKAPEPIEVKNHSVASLQWQPFTGGVVEVGHDGEGFAFDCEAPQHKVYVEDFALADRAITTQNGVRLWLTAGMKIHSSGFPMAGRLHRRRAGRPRFTGSSLMKPGKL